MIEINTVLFVFICIFAVVGAFMALALILCIVGAVIEETVDTIEEKRNKKND